MHADSWALKAKKLGFRSRAVFKLEEILTRTKALKKNSLVLDIGSAPGGWSELVKACKSESGGRTEKGKREQIRGKMSVTHLSIDLWGSIQYLVQNMGLC